MSKEDRAAKWLVIVKEDLSVAEDLFKTGHWLYVASSLNKEKAEELLDNTKLMYTWILQRYYEKTKP